jgi:hypothetical protein
MDSVYGRVEAVHRARHRLIDELKRKYFPLVPPSLGGMFPNGEPADALSTKRMAWRGWLMLLAVVAVYLAWRSQP